MEETDSKKEKWLGAIEAVFWIAFIAVPIFTGILAYHWLPNEAPILADGQVLKPYKILESHEECRNSDSGSQCSTVPDAWENTDTGQVFTQADFHSHRISERSRMTVTWFLYGLVGCVFFAGTQYIRKKDFYKYFGIAVVVDLVVAGWTYMSAKT